ncbi:MAG: hypothetical protein ABJB74_18070 [Gemmatimonas sp.]
MSFFGNLRDIFGNGGRDARVMARVALEKRKRLTEMADDPARRKYVERIERGEHWRDEEIAFNEDANATGVCEHLFPIEQLMRLNGIDLRPEYALVINANCLVNIEKLQLQIGIVEPIRYMEPHIPDRSMLDPRSAMFVCSRCVSTIRTVHLDSVKPDTPSFPS